VAKAQAAYKKFADLCQLPSPNYQIGDKVFLAMKHIQTTRPTAKLANKRTGPYKIIKIINKNAVRLALPKSFRPTHPTFNVSLLEPAPRNSIPGRTQVPPDPVKVDGHSEWEIVEVLKSRYQRGKLQYRFLWLGFKDNNAKRLSWHNAINAEHVPNLVAAFHAKNPQAAGPGVMLTVKPPPKSSEGGLDAGVRAELTVLGM